MKIPDQTVAVALGSNLGGSAQIFRRAISKLRDLSVTPVRVSSFWKTAPVDCPPGSPDFLNAVCVITVQAGERPESLLLELQTLEKEFGRRPKKVLNEPRPLDLDIIAFGQERRSGERLTLPHPRAAQRRFVLGPLAELEPDWVLPGRRLTIAALLQRLRD